MFVDLNTFIKVDFIRQELSKSCSIVSNIEEANNIAIDISNGISKNIIFEKSSLKNYCFSKIKELCEDVVIVNCNSCLERFCENIQQDSEVRIFDNLNQCKNPDILNLIKNLKGTIIC